MLVAMQKHKVDNNGYYQVLKVITIQFPIGKSVNCSTYIYIYIKVWNYLCKVPPAELEYVVLIHPSWYHAGIIPCVTVNSFHFHFSLIPWSSFSCCNEDMLAWLTMRKLDRYKGHKCWKLLVLKYKKTNSLNLLQAKLLCFRYLILTYAWCGTCLIRIMKARSFHWWFNTISNFSFSLSLIGYFLMIFFFTFICLKVFNSNKGF